jgi:hypothetical protein
MRLQQVVEKRIAAGSSRGWVGPQRRGRYERGRAYYQDSTSSQVNRHTAVHRFDVEGTARRSIARPGELIAFIDQPDLSASSRMKVATWSAQSSGWIIVR